MLIYDKYWQDDETFELERFLNDQGNYDSTKNAAFVPFSVGRRFCPDDQLALNELFLCLVRFLQLTYDYDITLAQSGANDDDLCADPIHPIIQFPKDLNIMIKNK